MISASPSLRLCRNCSCNSFSRASNRSCSCCRASSGFSSTKALSGILGLFVPTAAPLAGGLVSFGASFLGAPFLPPLFFLLPATSSSSSFRAFQASSRCFLRASNSSSSCEWRAISLSRWRRVCVSGLLISPGPSRMYCSSRVLAYAAGSARQLLISCATAFSFRENWSSGKSGIYDAADRVLRVLPLLESLVSPTSSPRLFSCLRSLPKTLSAPAAAGSAIAVPALESAGTEMESAAV
mmetsp:Transcript_15764/g.27733  ORF Transcript_15764/g.27733 Transcript_15764/m.27733 type:complete len:239 (+) Transcript_15764:1651-2367(+)